MGDRELFACFCFFQAEDGIRDVAVTGVQTCALPIFDREQTPAGDSAPGQVVIKILPRRIAVELDRHAEPRRGGERSEERRVGKECRTRWTPHRLKKKTDARQASLSRRAAMPRTWETENCSPVFVFFKQKTAYEM